MVRFLVLCQLVSFGLIAFLGARVLQEQPAVQRVGHAAEVSRTAVESVELDVTTSAGSMAGASAELDVLRRENRDLVERLEAVELELLSMNQALDDAQSMALKNSLHLAGETTDASPVFIGSTSSESELSPTAALVDPFVDAGPTGVSPVFDQAVRQVLASIETEREASREERREEREQMLFTRLGERFELTEGQVTVIQRAHEQRAADFRALRSQVREGNLPQELAREQGRLIQERYRGEIGGVVSSDDVDAVNRFLNRGGRDDRRGRGNERNRNDRNRNEQKKKADESDRGKKS